MNSRLLAIKMTGRTAAAAVYFGRDLHYTELRQLAPDITQARDSLIGFISSLIEHFYIDSGAWEECPPDTRALMLTASIIDLLREKDMLHWTIKKSVVMAAFGQVPFTRLHDLRQAVSGYWPHIIAEWGDDTWLDAAALGLYLQTERLLSENYPASI
jgi:hypothetical protein